MNKLMSIRLISFARLHLIALPLLLIAFVVGCAGGSKGTGGVSERTLKGQIVRADPSTLGVRSVHPASGITVTILETGDSGITDADGNYNITAELESSTLTYAFAGMDTQAVYSLEIVDVSASVIDVDFEISSDGKEAIPTKVAISQPPTPNPAGSGDDDDDSATPPPNNGGGKPNPSPDPQKVTICHQNKRTIEVSNSALESHLSHGDTLGPCPGDPDPKKPVKNKADR